MTGWVLENFDCENLPPPKVETRKVLKDWKKECARVGGKAQIFSDGCVDECSEWENPTCSEAEEEGCKCPANQCWYKNTCVNKPPWHQKFRQN